MTSPVLEQLSNSFLFLFRVSYIFVSPNSTLNSRPTKKGRQHASHFEGLGGTTSTTTPRPIKGNRQNDLHLTGNCHLLVVFNNLNKHCACLYYTTSCWWSWYQENLISIRQNLHGYERDHSSVVSFTWAWTLNLVVSSVLRARTVTLTLSLADLMVYWTHTSMRKKAEAKQQQNAARVLFHIGYPYNHQNPCHWKKQNLTKYLSLRSDRTSFLCCAIHLTPLNMQGVPPPTFFLFLCVPSIKSLNSGQWTN